MAAMAALLGTWQDEEYTLATTAHGVAYALHRAITFELQAPLYFGLLAALRLLDPSVFFARMFSVVAACGLTLVAASLAKRVWPQGSSRTFALFVAFNPFVVYAALEIRLYALTLLVSAALWLAFDAGFLRDESKSARAATIGLAIAAAYLQYFLIFELAAFGVALLVARRGRALGAYILAMIPVALAFVPMALRLHSQLGGAFSVAVSRSGAHPSIFVHPLLDFTLPLGYEAMFGSFGHMITYVLVALVAALFVAGRPALDVRTRAIVTVAVGVEALYLIVADVLHYELSPPRHFVALFVPEAVAVYALVASFRGPQASRCRSALVLVLGLATAVSLAADNRALAKHGDWPRVAAMLASATRAGDVIAVFPADGVFPLERYYHGAARLVPFPRALPPNHYDVDALLVHSRSEALRALGHLPQNGRLWFVDYGNCSRADFYGCVEMRSALAANYGTVERRAFFESEVARLVPRPKGVAGRP